MAKPLHHLFLHHFRHHSPTSSFRFLNFHSRRHLSISVTPYPLQYEMIITRPANPPLPTRTRRTLLPPPHSQPDPPQQQLSFDQWVDHKLSTKDKTNINDENSNNKEVAVVMDKSKRKYYDKRRKRMYGESESESESYDTRNDCIELKQEVVELRTLHQREEELFFHDAFTYPWEKNKHYKMVYQLEKKYFPDQCFEKAFLDPGKVNNVGKVKRDVRSKGIGGNDSGMVFFEEGEKEVKVEDVSEKKKVGDFFKGLKKFDNGNGGGGRGDGGDDDDVGPFLSTRSVGLPPKWDGPYGTVVLINKPKGSYFVM